MIYSSVQSKMRYDLKTRPTFTARKVCSSNQAIATNQWQQLVQASRVERESRFPVTLPDQENNRVPRRKRTSSQF